MHQLANPDHLVAEEEDAEEEEDPEEEEESKISIAPSSTVGQSSSAPTYSGEQTREYIVAAVQVRYSLRRERLERRKVGFS